MKQVLITREQLYKIIREVNSNVAADFAVENKDLIMGLYLTTHTYRVMQEVCDILFLGRR